MPTTAAPLLPKGTILKITSWHDNTAANKNNPDPNQWVGWGDRTVDEMAHAWVNITYMEDEDFKVEVEKRKASARRRPPNGSSSSSSSTRLSREPAGLRVDPKGRSSRRRLSVTCGIIVSISHRCSDGPCMAAAVVLLGSHASARQLPLQPARERARASPPRSKAGIRIPTARYTLLIGYFNRNMKQTLDIPVGPNNRIEPGGPDQGQPTYFLPRRQWGVFAIKVPKDFGDKRLTWTITANGQTNSIPVGVIKGYQVEPFLEAAQRNEPPRLQFDPKGPTFPDRPSASRRR